MTDPENGNVQVVVRRRRTSRHRRNRRIRRWLAGAVVAAFSASVSIFALQYLSPSLFHARQPEAVVLQQSEISRNHAAALNQALSHVQPPRPVYPYSVVPGGVADAKELKWVAEHDPVVAAHYAGFDFERAQVVRLALARTVYVSYRIGINIYWTRRRLMLHKGETVITDGKMIARTRCANRVEEAPQQQAASPVEPAPEKFEEPFRPGEGTAVQGPPVGFESALLNRPGTGGLGAAGPLSLYDPFVGGAGIPFSPAPLPLDVCEPVKKTTGTGSSGGGPGKKKVSPCSATGAPGVVPEPGTWLLFASGLAAIYWAARRKPAQA